MDVPSIVNRFGIGVFDTTQPGTPFDQPQLLKRQPSVLYRTAPRCDRPVSWRVDNNGDAGLERIRHLEERLSRAPIHSDLRRLLAGAIRIEAGLYRKSLDAAQASEQFAAKGESPATSRFSQLGVPVKSRGLQ